MSKIHPLIKDDMDVVLDAKVAAGHMAAPSWGVRAAEQVASADVVTVDGAVVIDPVLVNNGLRYPRWALGCLDYHGWIRQGAIRIIEWPGFDNISMAIIFLNCITLALYDPKDSDCETQRCQIIEGIDLGFTAFFTFECIIKVVAMGFWGPGSYLDDGWNRLDFMIVVFGLFDFVPGLKIDALAMVRAFRVIRPLRAINRLPSLRILLNLIFETLPMLGNVALLCLFLFMVFSILGMQLWAGELHNRCFPPNVTSSYFCGDCDGSNSSLCECEGPYLCAMEPNDGVGSCPPRSSANWYLGEFNAEYSECKQEGPNPDSDVISFDNFYMAFVTIFVVLTMEYWTEVMYKVQMAYSFWVWIFFFAVVVMGSLVAVNLFLVVITTQFSETKANDRERQAKLKRARAKNGEAREHTQLEKDNKGRDRWTAFMRWLCPCANPVGQQSSMKVVDEEKEDQKSFKAVIPGYQTSTVRSGWGFRRSSSPEPLAPPANNTTADNPLEGKTEAKSDTEMPSAALVPAMGAIVTMNETENPVAAAPVAAGGSAIDPGIPTVSEDLEGAAAEDAAAELPWPGGCVGHIRVHVRRLVSADMFNNTIMILIILNTMVMASEFYGQPDGLTAFQVNANYFFTGAFLLEMLLKLFGLGVSEYVSDSMNIFDGAIVFSSLVELAAGGGGMLSVLRTFRLLRIFKLMRFIPSLQRQMSVMVASLGEVSNFCLILFLFMFIEAVLGMFLFGAKLQGRSHFDDFYHAMVTVFQILTIEDWPGVMFDAIAATSYLAAAYFIILLIIGTYILSNLFVAILLEGFAERAAEEEQKIKDALRASQNAAFVTKLKAAFANGSQAVTFHYWRAVVVESQKSRGESGESRRNSRGTAHPSPVVKMDDKTGTEPDRSDAEEEIGEDQTNAVGEYFGANKDDPDATPAEAYTDGKAFGCLAGDNCLRMCCATVVRNPWFDHTILLFIGLNSLCMAEERPSIQDGSTERFFLNVMGYIFTGIFLIEFVLKVITFGVFCGEHAYFKNAWNKLDGFLVTVSVIDTLFFFIGVEGGKILAMLRILRLMRALRPLRAINKAPKLKLVVKTLIASLKTIGSTIMISSVVFLIFGILSVQLFAGKMYYCTLEEGTCNGTEIEVATKVDCACVEGNWKNQTYNFDNLLQALLSLFYVASFDGWVDVMYNTVDANAVDQVPKQDANIFASIFFIVFLVIANFFVLNMFVGVIVDSFQCSGSNYGDDDKKAQHIQQELRAKQKVIDEQERYEHCVRLYRADFGECKNQIVKGVESVAFDNFITGTIILNTLAMCVQFHNQPASMTTVLEMFNYVFTAIFAIEAALKLYIFGCHYFNDAWNKFDFFIVIMSFFGLLVDHVIGDAIGINPAFIRVLRVFRIARVIKLLKAAKGLQALLETVIKSLSQVASVGMLLFLFFFIYAAAGVEMFGKLACTEDNECNGFSELANFENFPMAMLTLFRISTGDNGSGMLSDAQRTAPDCSEEIKCEYNCCSDPFIAALFFGSFTVVAQFVLLNVVIAVLMAQLEEANEAADAQAEAAEGEEQHSCSDSESSDENEWAQSQTPVDTIK